MASKELTLDSVRKMAEELGMHRFTDAHVEELLRATNAARARRSGLKIETLDAKDEPAHVFRAKGG
jgi:hypothetical protein